MKKHTMGFDGWGLLLFAAIMLPNLIWMLLPAPNDVLRTPSVTPVVDGIASFCQMLMVFCLCFIRRVDEKPTRLSPMLWCVIGCVLLYWVAWAAYYLGFIHTGVILCMTLLPCAAFLLYLTDRRNLFGLVPAVLFTLCHLIFAIANFLMQG